jgi:hypothetical protein
MVKLIFSGQPENVQSCIAQGFVFRNGKNERRFDDSLAFLDCFVLQKIQTHSHIFEYLCRGSSSQGKEWCLYSA